MTLWRRPQEPPAVDALREDLQRLAAAVERLEAQHRRDAEEIGRLRQAIAEGQRQAEKERRRLLERVDASHRVDAKWRKIFNNQLTALVRHICLPLDRLDPPHALNARRFRLRSQNEEDGILFALLERAGWGTRRFVEIGSGKSGGNSAALARDCGWSGLMIELSPAAVELARRKFEGNRGVTVVAARVTPENVNGLLADHGFGGSLDVLSIDIDSYDYWILEALVALPRILILEYNALFGPERRVTIPLGQPLDSAPKGYNGASLAALTDLAARKGYRLVTCENAGVNAFYLREDVAPDIPAVTPLEAFKPLRSRTEVDDDAWVHQDLYDTIRKLNLPLVEV